MSSKLVCESRGVGQKRVCEPVPEARNVCPSCCRRPQTRVRAGAGGHKMLCKPRGVGRRVGRNSLHCTALHCTCVFSIAAYPPRLAHQFVASGTASHTSLWPPAPPRTPVCGLRHHLAHTFLASGTGSHTCLWPTPPGSHSNLEDKKAPPKSFL